MARSRPALLRGFRTSLSAVRAGLSWLQANAGKVITTAIALAGVTLVGSGIPLIWRYEPADSSALGLLHESAGYLLIILMAALAVWAPLARFQRRRSHVGWGAAAALVVLTLAAGTTGVAIAWDEIHTPSHVIFGDLGTGETHTVARPPEMVDPGAPLVPPDQDTGITAATQEGVVRIVSDGAPLAPDEYSMFSWLHLAVVPILTAATYAGSRYLYLRRRRGAEAPDRGEAGETATDNATDATEDGGDSTPALDDDGTPGTDAGIPDATDDDGDAATSRRKRGRSKSYAE